MLEQPQKIVREVRQALETHAASVDTASMTKEVERLLNSHLKAQDQTLQRAFKKQEAALSNLEKELDLLNRRSRGQRRGVPWSLLILGAAGYVLWSNASAREKVVRLVQQGIGQRGKEEAELTTQPSPPKTPPVLRLEEPIAVKPLMVQPPQTPSMEDKTPVDSTAILNRD